MININNMKRVAFISSEFAIENLPTYAGGLGILAGDLLYSARDLGYNFYGVTFVNKKGYHSYKIINKDIVYVEEEYEPLEYFKLYDTLYIDLKNTRIYFNVWLYDQGKAKLFLIDTDVSDNDEKIRGLTGKLYGEKSEEEAILKYLLLGLGTLEIFDRSGINIDVYHLNESHGGFLSIELMKRYGLDYVKEHVVYTTHSIIAGHLKFRYDLVEKYYDVPNLIKEISKDELNLSYVLTKIINKKNCVSLKHKIVTENIFKEKFDYVTNGVYHRRWVNSKLAILYDTYLHGWHIEPAKFAYASIIKRKDFISVKKNLKRELVEFINSEATINKKFDEDRILISVRRRLTEYKRFHMLLWRLERLEELNKKYNIEFLISGVFHPDDKYVKDTIKWILDIMSTLSTPIALLLRRGIELEKYILAGSDLFLHVPRPPFEACGTSWMRAAINGTPTLFSMDGGPLEIIIDDYNGWFFGENIYDPYNSYDSEKDLNEFYEKLEYILNTYKNNFEKYVEISINAIKTVGPLFNSYRNLKDYVYKYYEG